MSTDVQAAAERRETLTTARRALKCLALELHPQVYQNAAPLIEAGLALAAVPADDSLLLSPEFLKSVGYGEDGLSYVIDCEIETGTIKQWPVWRRNGDRWGVCNKAGKWIATDMPTTVELPTRGHLRRLSACLGVPLTEPPSAAQRQE